MTCVGLIGSCGGDIEVIERPVTGKYGGERIVTTHKCLKCGKRVIVASRKKQEDDMAVLGEIRWHCNGCKYTIVITDANGRDVKKVPKTCPSCGRPSKEPEVKKRKKFALPTPTTRARPTSGVRHQRDFSSAPRHIIPSSGSFTPGTTTSKRYAPSP